MLHLHSSSGVVLFHYFQMWPEAASRYAHVAALLIIYNQYSGLCRIHVSSNDRKNNHSANALWTHVTRVQLRLVLNICL